MWMFKLRFLVLKTRAGVGYPEESEERDRLEIAGFWVYSTTGKPVSLRKTTKEVG